MIFIIINFRFSKLLTLSFVFVTEYILIDRYELVQRDEQLVCLNHIAADCVVPEISELVRVRFEVAVALVGVKILLHEQIGNLGGQTRLPASRIQ